MSAAMSEYWRHFYGWLDEFETALRSHRKPVDPRDPDPSRPGIFRDHNCARCKDGEKPCVRGNPRACEFPHARND